MARNIVVSEAAGHFIEDIPVEIVERKGIGHPDSLCDGIAERISREYTRWCDRSLHVMLHHNFDKVQLVAGEVRLAFGRGEMIQPIRIQVAGRGTPQYNGTEVPMDEIAVAAAVNHLRETMRHLDPDRHVRVEVYAGRGAAELVDISRQSLANDTSFGCSHWPRSGLERVVFETAEYINRHLIDELPIGEDIKVMGLRRDHEIVLTVALPFLALRVQSLEDYRALRAEARDRIADRARSLDHRSVTVYVNTADDDQRGDHYLTLTGTSAEMGDDGSVGRGNRVNGLITPFRNTSLEAAAGKNPFSHVGKVYNVLSLLIAQEIVQEVPEVREAAVYLLSQIGCPLDQPLVATATVHPNGSHLPPAARERIAAIIDRNLENGPQRVRELLLDGAIPLY